MMGQLMASRADPWCFPSSRLAGGAERVGGSPEAEVRPAQATRAKISRRDYIKLKIVCLAKETTK